MQKSRRQPHLSVPSIVFFSYTWFKYELLLLHCCDLRSLVVNALAFPPSHVGSIRVWVMKAWNGSIRRTGKETRVAIFFLLENLALQLGLGQGSDASLRDSNYVAAAFSLTKATYRYASLRLPA